MATKPDRKLGLTKDILLGNTQGAALATHLANRSTNAGAGGKKKGRAKVKLIKPPPGGWV